MQTLQTLNGETKTLQRKLQLQLKELMTLTLQDGEIFPPTSPPSSSSSSFSSSSSSSSTSASSASSSSSSSSGKSSSEKSTGGGGGGGGVGGSTGQGGNIPLPPFRVSLLSLLADFIDSSCNELRADLQDINTAHTQGTGQGTGQGVGQGQGQGQGRASSGSSSALSDTDSDSSYEMISAMHLEDVEGARHTLYTDSIPESHPSL